MAESRHQKIKQRAFNKISEHHKKIKNWMFLMNCSLLMDGKNDAPPQAVRAFATVIAERENDLTPILEQSFTECLSAQSITFIDLLKQVIFKGSEANLVSCTDYTKALHKLVNKFKANDYKLSSVEEDLTSLMTAKGKNNAEDDVLKYVLEEIKHKTSSDELKQLEGTSKNLKDLLAWTISSDDKKTQKNLRLMRQRYMRSAMLGNTNTQMMHLMCLGSMMYLVVSGNGTKLGNYVQDELSLSDKEFQIAKWAFALLIGIIGAYIFYKIESKIYKAESTEIYKHVQDSRLKINDELLDEFNKFLDIKIVEFVDDKKPILNFRLVKNFQSQLLEEDEEKEEKSIKEKIEKTNKSETSKEKLVRMIKESKDDKSQVVIQEYIKTNEFYQRTVVDGPFITLFVLPRDLKAKLKANAPDDVYRSLMDAFKFAPIRKDSKPCIKKLSEHPKYSYEVKPNLNVPNRLFSVARKDSEGRDIHLMTEYSARGLHS